MGKAYCDCNCCFVCNQSPGRHLHSNDCCCSCGAQAITAEGKIKKVSYLAVSAIALTFAFPAFSGLVKVLCMLAAYSVLSVKSSKKAAFAAVGVIAVTFVFPILDVIVKIGAALAIAAYAGAYEDALAEQG